jgi:predicted small metal-binding protein
LPEQWKGKAINIYLKGTFMKNALACQDLGVSNCSFEARSENKTEVVDALFGHAQKYHADVMSKLSDKEKADMTDKMNGKMKRV